MGDVVSIGNPRRSTLYQELLAVTTRHEDMRLEDIIGVLELLKMDYYEWSKHEQE